MSEEKSVYEKAMELRTTPKHKKLVEETLEMLRKCALEHDLPLDKNAAKAIVDNNDVVFWAVKRLLSVLGGNMPAEDFYISFTKGAKFSAGPLFIDAEGRVAFQEKVQAQIGKGDVSPKIGFAGAGFGFPNKHESPAEAAVRNCKDRLGVSIVLPAHASFFGVLKDLYDISNEKDVYGIVKKVPILLTDEMKTKMEETAKGDTLWLFPNEIATAVAEGRSSLVDKELEFLSQYCANAEAISCMKLHAQSTQGFVDMGVKNPEALRLVGDVSTAINVVN